MQSYSSRDQTTFTPKKAGGYATPGRGKLKPTQKQINFLRNLGYGGDIPDTRHEASDLIDVLRHRAYGERANETRFARSRSG